MCTVAAASGAASVRVRHIMSRGWDPWTERPLPEGVRVAYPHALANPRHSAPSSSGGPAAVSVPRTSSVRTPAAALRF